MSRQYVNGEQALAWGAVEAGVSVVAGYPGSPGTNTFNALQAMSKDHDHHTEWCVNERIALDIGAGSSQGGKRALVCLKSVGMNVALDTLMVLNMTGTHAGLVILMGDDPGAWGSQNEQDTRPIAPFAELPMVEPSNPAEGRATMKWAFEYSEQHQTIVIMRITRSYSVQIEEVDALDAPSTKPSLEPAREPWRFVSALKTVDRSHRRLHKKLATIESEFETSSLNSFTGSGKKGIITTGFVHTKFQEAVEGADLSDVAVLKLGTIYPLPAQKIGDFLKNRDEVLVFEEVDPYLEDAIKTVGYDAGASAKILGKRTGDVNWVGELFRWHIQDTLRSFLPGFSPANTYTEENWEEEKPFRKAHCSGCPYVEIILAFRDEAEKLGQNPFMAGDPGCLVIAAEYLDAKLCMGSAFGVASGWASAGVTERTVAVVGDSAFYHGGLPALVQARATNANTLTLVLDNGGALTTGGQPTPDGGIDLGDGTGPTVGIDRIARACGVDPIWEVTESDSEERMREVFREALQNDSLSMVIVRKACKPVD
ncbi:MAG: hypothetical protein CME26_16255 [Gemmatimonadetes bacterium]|nr:hypothetical protein [Gemmatimonadota bacterium]|tara:strand:+ start:7522 stop:9138 length:1617 start_codon:yes stop_codon:yes gene_type:complete